MCEYKEPTTCFFCCAAHRATHVELSERASNYFDPLSCMQELKFALKISHLFGFLRKSRRGERDDG